MILPDRAELESLVARIDPQLHLDDWHPMVAGSSASLVGLDVSGAGTRRAWVLRIYRRGNLNRRRDAARREYRLLERLMDGPVAAPRPVRLEVERPSIVIERLEGRPILWPDALHGLERVAARHLCAIHGVPTVGLDFLPAKRDEIEAALSTPSSGNEDFLESTIRERLMRHWYDTPANDSVLLHGDFWHGNWLWSDDRLLVGVVDWEDAAVGDPLFDVANCRLELATFFGVVVAETFTEHYLRNSGVDAHALPVWDLVAALKVAAGVDNWRVDPASREKMRHGQARFVDQAFRRLNY